MPFPSSRLKSCAFTSLRERIRGRGGVCGGGGGGGGVECIILQAVLCRVGREVHHEGRSRMPVDKTGWDPHLHIKPKTKLQTLLGAGVSHPEGKVKNTILKEQ